MPKKDSTKFGLVNMGRLKVLNDTKLSRMSMSRSKRHLRSIWYHSEPSDFPYYPNQFLSWDFFCLLYSKLALAIFKMRFSTIDHCGAD